MKAFIAVLLLLIAGLLGYMVYDHVTEKRHAEDAMLRQKLQDAIQASWRAQVGKAIIEKRVIEGMTRYEVRQAWGYTYKATRSDIPDSWRKLGVYEVWHFNDIHKGFVGMSVDGEVLAIGNYTP